MLNYTTKIRLFLLMFVSGCLVYSNVSANTFSGYIDENNRDAWHSITFATDGELLLNMTVDATLNLNNSSSLRIYESNKTTSIESFKGPAGSSDLSGSYGPVPLKAGSYYIKVYRKDGYGAYTLDVTQTGQPLVNDTEPNDAFQYAAVATVGASVTGHLGYMGGGSGSSSDREDWWQITLGSSGALTLEAAIDATLNLNTTYGLSIYDVNGSSRVSYFSGPAGGSDLSGNYGPVPLNAGTYYIKIYRKEGYGAYSLQINFSAQPVASDTEPNDEFQTSNAASLDTVISGNLGYKGGGNGSSDDSEDWWSVALSGDGAFTIEVTVDDTLNLNKSSGIAIYDKNGSTRIENFYGPAGALDLTGSYGPIPLKAGNYYVKVNCKEGYGAYTINMSHVVQTILNDPEPNDEFQYASAAAFGASVSGHLGYMGDGSGSSEDDEDWWNITVSNNGAMTLQVTVDATLNLNKSSGIYIYAADGSTRIENFSGPAGERDLTGTYGPVSLTAGSYYIKISPNNGYGGYTILPTFSSAGSSGGTTTTTTSLENPTTSTTTTVLQGVTTTTIPTTTTTLSWATTTSVPAGTGMTIDFMVSPSVGFAPLSVNFINLSQGDIAGYRWVFGDGSTSTEENPNHTYMSMGSYSVVLTATGRDGTERESIRPNCVQVLPRIPCVLSTALDNKEEIRILRKLRDSMLKNVFGILLTNSYYQNTQEISDILTDNSDLLQRLQELVSENIDIVRLLSSEGEVAVSAHVLDEFLDILYDLKAEGSLKLQLHIGLLTDGIENGYLIRAFGVTTN